ncbi:hypothetical protein Barb7_00231 [Bacteroidales bacterium Barb7]|nr:hypothetical protein Barb7_00231 [Bacteroidales bacterium Barb7]
MKTSHVKGMACGCLLSVAVLSAAGQQNNPRLIVRSDDMGAFHSANVAAVEAYRNGIETVVEVMPVTSWFLEAARMLCENTGIDAGIHLAITSEWDNIKWRPLTACPSLTDADGYFFPMMSANGNYPGLSVSEHQWKLSEIEKEFRAQIKLGLKHIPHASHLSGHMGSMTFDKDVTDMASRLAEEYNLSFLDKSDAATLYNLSFAGYDGSNREKESSFLRMLDKLEKGRNYLFVDHPALNNDEMQTVGHIGYEWVAEDRQGVTDLLTSPRIKQAVKDKGIELITYNELTKSLPRSTAAVEKVSSKHVAAYLEAVKKSGQDVHSVMIVRHGKVVSEHWFGENAANKPHILHSVSKTFTATAVGFAVSEGRLKVTDKVISFFPDKLPVEVNPNLKGMEIRHLLMMSAGHDVDPTSAIRNNGADTDWAKQFLAWPVLHKPGSVHVYNSLATYMLSAIVQQVTGEKVIDYLYPRLFRPLGIVGAKWGESPQGINTGGWGLYLKTEDLAKTGQLFLQKGKWNGKQLLPEAWIEEASTSKIASLPAGTKKEAVTVKAEDSDWLQGYGYQMWRSRHNSYRADGARGQYILILPEKEAVIAITSDVDDMQLQLNLVWKHLLPALK